MQRVRTSIPYFAEGNWNAEIVVVDECYTDMNMDNLLSLSVPDAIKVHKVKAFRKAWTSKFGLGSIAIRSLWFYQKKVDRLLESKHYDLIYFSTTQFPVCILGPHWKKKYRVPYVIDMQDPWHSDYYRDKAKRPPKYWFSYRLNKYLEPLAMEQVSGLISVSESYIKDLKARYPVLEQVPSATITFGAFDPDMVIAEQYKGRFRKLLDDRYTNIVYTGRGGTDMHAAISAVFKVLKRGIDENKTGYDRLKFYFIGTSYAPAGQGKPSIMPLARIYGVDKQVTELTDRINYYHSLNTLLQADALFIPGSDDPGYSASKIYPYLLTQKKILAIFNRESPAISILKEHGVDHVYDYQRVQDADIDAFLSDVSAGHHMVQQQNAAAVNKYSARALTLSQCRFFDRLFPCG